MMRVLIASGGSGGHIFPAISLARELEKEGARIIFVASRRRLDRDMLKNAPYRKVFIPANPMPYRLGLRALLFVPRLIFGMLASLAIMVWHKPEAVVGFGGDTSGPVLLTAVLLGKKTIIHEQNIVPGRTNKFLDRFVRAVAVSFQESRKYFKNKNVFFTGNPLREESLRDAGRKAASRRLGLAGDKSTVLVMGGSQGAKSLNELCSKSINLLHEAQKNKLQVLHIAGPKNAYATKQFYETNRIKSAVFGFVDDISAAYSACDIAISRSGAAAIFELAAFGKPMILVPYPSAKNNQRYNAIFFAERGAAIYKDEKNMSEGGLKEPISELLENNKRCLELSENAKKLSVKNGAFRLKEVVLR